jgi:tetratricopeptide (TPR) repeat protein
MKKSYLNLLFVLMCCFGATQFCAAKAAEPAVSKCLGENKEPFAVDLVAVCTTIAHSTKVKNADRAIVFLHLGEIQYWKDFRLSKSSKEALKGALQLWREGLKVDPKNGPLNLAIAFAFGESGDQAAKADHLKLLVKTYPTNGLFKSALAEVSFQDKEVQSVTALCEDAVGLAPHNFQVLMSCATASRYSGDENIALEYASLAKPYFKPRQRMVYGIIQPNDPYFFIADVYEKQGDEQRAFEVFTELKEKSGVNMLSLAALRRGQLGVKLGKYEEAADDFLDASKKFTEPTRSRMLVSAIFLLNKVGRNAESKSILSDFTDGNHWQRILMLQVRLRNGRFKNLEINGKYDEATQDAIRACMSSKECSEEFLAVKI